MYKPSFEAKKMGGKLIVKISVPSYEQGISKFTLKDNGRVINAVLVQGSYEYTNEDLGTHQIEMYYAPDIDILPDTVYKINERVYLPDNSNIYRYGGGF